VSDPPINLIFHTLQCAVYCRRQPGWMAGTCHASVHKVHRSASYHLRCGTHWTSGDVSCNSVVDLSSPSSHWPSVEVSCAPAAGTAILQLMLC